MAKMIALFIDDQPVSVPEGTLIVDAAKKCCNDIPVFCYHPKMEPVGMCRMCLVEIGRPQIDRTTNQPVLEADGSQKISFGSKLETACTTPVSPGMRVVTASDKVKAARHDVLEFLLTSHPLDCPICDKGGECPLQNLTLRFGPGTSRYEFDEKMHLAKHVPLGELIVLDRERCIQCGRCVRFEHDLAGDPVINFSQRGRALEIITTSDPGFDSIFSGDTTDICPVGALTTVDFRFGARPWELNTAASLCNHCPVGCNIVYNVRREGISGGKSVIKRVLPRQNEVVNEIWICDRGRFAYHYTESPQRLKEPLVRKNGELRPASWDEALNLVEAHLRDAGDSFVTLAGGRLANEDLFNLAQLGGKPVLYSFMSGGDLTARYGLVPGSNIGEIGKGSAILVVASDLHEEAPVWWLRIKQAVQRGAALIVVHPRQTRLDDFANHVLRCAYGDETATLRSLLFPENASDEIKAVAQAFTSAENAVVFYGSEGLNLPASTALAHACADLLVKTQHTGRPNNGLVGVWPNGNTQGAWDMGFRPSFDLPAELRQAKVALVAAADPAGDDPALATALEDGPFLVVQELFLTDTAKMADVVLPVQAYTEREGTYTSGERRVQRFYPAVRPLVGLLPDWAIAAQLGQRLGRQVEGRSASRVMDVITAALPSYSGLDYPKLAESPEQWPLVGRADLYYGGTSYDNHQGLGVALPLVEQGLPAGALPAPEKPSVPDGGLLVVPVSHLYDRGATLAPSTVLQMRMISGVGWLNPTTAARLGLPQGAQVSASLNGAEVPLTLHLDVTIPADTLMVPRLWPVAMVGAIGIGPEALHSVQAKAGQTNE
jgi:NADH-quinone oxidoreductase subunit G